MTGRISVRNLANSYGIVPMPQSIEVAANSDSFTLMADTEIVCQGEAGKACAAYLQQRLAAATGLTLAVTGADSGRAILLEVAPETLAFTEQDAYTFQSSADRILISGKSAAGVFYGVQTLLQLLPAAVYGDTVQAGLDLAIPALRISDKPSLDRIRGLHVDLARHFRTLDELRTIIDCMAMHKLNTLHLHLTDDEGWRVELEAYPHLTAVGAIGNKSNPEAPAAFLTQDDVRDLCAYAKSRYISVIPEIDMPGHMGAAIKSYPELKSATELRDPGKVMRIDEQGQAFAKAVLREIDGLFQPGYIHIGCDEVNVFVDEPIYTDEELQGFVQAMTSYVKDELKKTPIVWDDPFEKGFYDRDTVVQWWRYGKKHWWAPIDRTIDEGLNAEKQPFIMSPAYWTYFDMPNVRPEEGYAGWAQPISAAELYNWDPFEDMFGVTAATRELTLGAIACTWSENIVTMTDFGDRTFPRLAAYAERLWRGGKSEAPSILSWPEYRDRVLIPFQLKRYDALGIHYWSKDEPQKLLALEDKAKKL